MSDPPALTLPSELRAALDAFARVRGQDPAQVVEEAVAEYLDGEAAWAAHLERALKQADAGQMATPDEVARVFGNSIGVHREAP